MTKEEISTLFVNYSIASAILISSALTALEERFGLPTEEIDGLLDDLAADMGDALRENLYAPLMEAAN